ncbi:MAG: hypothetical protein ACF8Q5_08930 [Phycisphaerales bacterium JB040]
MTEPDSDLTNTKPESRVENRPRRAAVRVTVVTPLITVCGAIASCIRMERPNPYHKASCADVREEMKRMKDEPVEPDRPALVLSGNRSPAGSAFMLNRSIVSLAGDRKGVICVRGQRVATVNEAEILDALLKECKAFQSKVQSGEARLGEKKVDIVPPDPEGELGSGWEKMAAKRIAGQADLTIGQS